MLNVALNIQHLLLVKGWLNSTFFNSYSTFPTRIQPFLTRIQHINSTFLTRIMLNSTLFYSYFRIMRDSMKDWNGREKKWYKEERDSLNLGKTFQILKPANQDVTKWYLFKLVSWRLSFSSMFCSFSNQFLLFSSSLLQFSYSL